MKCEECGAPLKLGGGEVHHKTADGLAVDKSQPLTAEDGVLLCSGPGSCHARHTASDVPAIARAKRIEAAHLGEKTQPKRKIASRADAKKKRPHAERRALERRNLYEGV